MGSHSVPKDTVAREQKERLVTRYSAQQNEKPVRKAEIPAQAARPKAQQRKRDGKKAA